MKVGDVMMSDRRRGIYVLLRRHNDKQWWVLILEADTMDSHEIPGETRVLNEEWLDAYTRGRPCS